MTLKRFNPKKNDNKYNFIEIIKYYSYLTASIGLILAALYAG
jgi:hypothetical protein